MPVKKKRKAVKRKRPAKAKKSRRSKVKRRVVTRSIQVVSGKKQKARKRKRSVRRGQKIRVAHVVAGKRKRARSTVHRKRSRPRKRRVVMAGTRRRSVGKKSNSGLLIGLGIGALALYLFTRPKTTTYPNISQLPPLNATSNYQRNDQQNQILQYALAASLGIDAITKLISSLNSSSDSQVQQVYDQVNTTGTLPDSVYV